MSDASQVFGSPVEMEIGGQVWKFAPLTLGDNADFEQWAASKRLRAALDALGADATGGERSDLVRSMLDESSMLAAMAEMQSFAGIRHLLFLSLRHNHPEATEEEVGNLVTLRRIDELKSLLDLLSDDGGAAPEGDAVPPVKPPRKPKAGAEVGAV